MKIKKLKKKIKMAFYKIMFYIVLTFNQNFIALFILKLCSNKNILNKSFIIYTFVFYAILFFTIDLHDLKIEKKRK